MKKKEIVILSLLIISLITVSLYQTLATDITMNKTNSTTADLSYTFDITDQTGRVVNVKAGATKVLDIFVTNSNNGTINYGIAYTPSTVKTNDITIAQLSTSKDKVSGLINKDERKQITLVIINNSNSDITLSLVAVTGYEHGGDLIVPDNHTLITEEYEIKETAPLATEYISNIFTSAGKTTVTNNSVNYQYATSVGMMEDVGGNIRYYGANPNNYVSFNNELWRIIGVFKNIEDSFGKKSTKLKIIKTNSALVQAFNSGTANNEWSTSSLNTYLNNTFYNSIESFYQGIISESVWNTGGLNAVGAAPKSLYESERGTTVYNNTKKTQSLSKIALSYPSDYGYAVDFQKCNKLLNAYNTTSCVNNDWLFLGKVERLLTPRGDNTGGGTTINATGALSFATTSNATNTIRPTLYLDSTIIFDKGNGSESNPYTILGAPKESATHYIELLLSSNPETMNNDDPDGNIRYMGANPNNYVRFNDELWRIIGVFNVASTNGGPTEKRLKIIRNESLNNMAWDSANTNNWASASLKTYLNGDYYNSIDSTSQSLIGDAVWNLGGTANYTSASNGLASHFYGYERGTTVYSGRPTYWIGKIGLMYPSDYGYATSGGTTTNRASCLATEMYNWDSSSYSDCKNNDYLFDSSNQWTITPLSSNSLLVFRVFFSGYVNVDRADFSNFSAAPVLYLKSTVEITGGEGTSSSPYTLG